MFAPSTFTAALVMTIISTICWGSFANTFKLTKNYRFELYYWDYAAGIFLISVVLALTMGSVGGGDQSFMVNMRSAAPMNLLYATIGGFIFNIANVLLIAGIEIAGLAIAFPIAIGIALVKRKRGTAGRGCGDGCSCCHPNRESLRTNAQCDSNRFPKGRDGLCDFRISNGSLCAIRDSSNDG
jgi:hypothetical protein